MPDLLIFPFNGNGLEALACLSPEFKLVGFIDDTPEKQGENKLGFNVYPRQQITRFKDALVLAVPGNSKNYLTRNQIIAALGIPLAQYATVISPQAFVSPLSKIGKNVLIMPGVIITSNAVIGDHVIILPNTVIHHDVEIGDYTLIGSGVIVAGYSKIGKNCYIGSGTNIINNVTIANGTLTGLGTNVIRSTSPDEIIIGNPGRPLVR